MNNKDLKESFSYILTRQKHWSKFQRRNPLIDHIVFIIILILVVPLPFIFSAYLKSKVKKIAVRKQIALVRTKNGLKIAKILEPHNSFDIVCMSVKGDRYFSKIDLLLSVFSSYDVYSNYMMLLKNSFLRMNLIKVVKVLGFSNLEKMFIDNHSLNSVIQFNDHSPESFYLHKICKIQNVETVYVQHAPVGDKFPALYHDINVLFSNDSLDKYQKSNDNLKVIIAFDFRFLKALNYRGNNKVANSVLLCPNLLDSITSIEQTAEALIKQGYDVRIRMHPADKRHLASHLTQSVVKDVWEDLAISQIVITNESAIPLEAAFLDCFVYKASFWSENIDAYNFIRRGLIISDEKSLENCIVSVNNRKQAIDFNKLEYYTGEIVIDRLKLDL